MTISVNHIAVPAHDHEASARLFADIMGLPYNGLHREFAPVVVNDHFALYFGKVEQFAGVHIAFHVSESEFAGIQGRLDALGIKYGSSPSDPTNMRVDHVFGTPGLFFVDPNLHLFEVMTKVAAW